MTKHDDGGAAYPMQFQKLYEHTDGTFTMPESGMTLEDYFAEGAMRAYIAAMYDHNVTMADVMVELLEEVPGASYAMAAAMVAEKYRREGGKS